MNVIQKSEAIKSSLRKGFQDGSSQMARRKCYGYEVGPDGELKVNPEEANYQITTGYTFGRIL